MKLVIMLLLSALVFFLIQNANYVQSTLASSINNTNGTSLNNIQNNPGYSQYIPGTGFLKKTPDNLGNESLNSATNGSGKASIDARMAMSNDADTGGLVQDNPGYSQYIPGTGFLNNNSTTNNNNNNNVNTNTTNTNSTNSQ